MWANLAPAERRVQVTKNVTFARNRVTSLVPHHIGKGGRPEARGDYSSSFVTTHATRWASPMGPPTALSRNVEFVPLPSRSPYAKAE